MSGVWTALGRVVCCVLLSGPASVLAASFDCSRAGTAVERMICADAGLSRLDERLADAFAQARMASAAPQELTARQRAWLSQERDACNDVQCLAVSYERRILELSAAPASPSQTLQPLPPAQPAPPPRIAVEAPPPAVSNEPAPPVPAAVAQPAGAPSQAPLAQGNPYDKYLVAGTLLCAWFAINGIVPIRRLGIPNRKVAAALLVATFAATAWAATRSLEVDAHNAGYATVEDHVAATKLAQARAAGFETAAAHQAHLEAVEAQRRREAAAQQAEQDLRQVQRQADTQFIVEALLRSEAAMPDRQEFISSMVEGFEVSEQEAVSLIEGILAEQGRCSLDVYYRFAGAERVHAVATAWRKDGLPQPSARRDAFGLVHEQKIEADKEVDVCEAAAKDALRSELSDRATLLAAKGIAVDLGKSGMNWAIDKVFGDGDK